MYTFEMPNTKYRTNTMKDVFLYNIETLVRTFKKSYAFFKVPMCVFKVSQKQDLVKVLSKYNNLYQEMHM